MAAVYYIRFSSAGTPAFREAVSAFLQSQFQGFGGSVTILVDDQNIDLNPHSDFAEAARQGSTQLAQASFENKTSGSLRPDAVHYCAAAVREFAGMSNEQVQALTFEIAMLGRNGFDVNSPEKKYRLKSKPGEFSGLELVCYMYAGFQRIAPGADVGFDLSEEYRAAKALVEGAA